MSNEKKKSKRPFKQGNLDALCGVYSLINAAKIVDESSDGKELFRKIINCLPNNKIKSIITDGTLFKKEIVQITKSIFADKWEYKIPYNGKKTPGLSDFWTHMSTFLEKNGNKAIIIGFDGKHNHWSVVHKITDDRLYLYDSSTLHYLPRSRCTTSEDNKRRHHALAPAQTIFIAKKENSLSES